MNIINVFEESFNKMKENGWDCIYVMVDIHGTIFKPSYDEIEEFNAYPLAIETLKLLSNCTKIKLILWSSTKLVYINHYITELKKYNVNIDFVNSNPDIIASDKDLYSMSFSYKPYFNVGIDDRFGFDALNDWKDLYDYLKIKLDNV